LAAVRRQVPDPIEQPGTDRSGRPARCSRVSHRSRVSLFGVRGMLQTMILHFSEGCQVAEFSCVFLNCNSLYEPGAHSKRAPLSDLEQEGKIAALAATIRAAFGGPPDLIALCEVAALG